MEKVLDDPTATANKEEDAIESFVATSTALDNDDAVPTTPAPSLPISVSAAYTFPSRLQKALQDQPYNNSMRRSVQTAILYEANRVHEGAYSTMKPFQRKIAMFETCKDILSTLTFIPVYHRIEVLFRTATGKTPLTPELAWRRMKLIDREISQAILPKFTELWNQDGGNKSHDYVCDRFLQLEFEESKGGQTPGKQYGPNWEFTHSNIFLTFRMFYNGPMIDTTVPKAIDPNPNREIPDVKPDYMETPNGQPQMNPRKLPRLSGDVDMLGLDSSRKRGLDDSDDDEDGAEAAGLAAGNMSMLRGRAFSEYAIKRRRALLGEVKDHLDVLNDFKGVIPDRDIAKRKRELYMSLPPAPYSDFSA